jgi:hypothetical protein
MRIYKVKILVELEKIFEEDAEASVGVDEMSYEIQAYLESMKHAVEPLWQECSLVNVKGAFNKQQVK